MPDCDCVSGPVTLATPVLLPGNFEDNGIGLAVGGRYVYWSLVLSKLWRVPTNGGAARLVTDDADRARIAYSDGVVYYTGWVQGHVRAWNVAAGFFTTLASGLAGPGAITVRDGEPYAYVIARDSGQIVRVARDGSGFNVLVDSQQGAFQIASDDQVLVWTNQTAGTLTKYEKATGLVSLLATAQAGPVSLAIAEGYVYWVNSQSEPNGISRTPVNGGPVQVVAPAANGGGIAAGDGRVYWAAGDSVWTAPVTGGTPLALASGQSTPGALAIDAGWVYWTNFYGGAILKVHQ